MDEMELDEIEWMIVVDNKPGVLHPPFWIN